MTKDLIPLKAVVIIGRICSGKSTIAKQISEKYGVSIASFGGYLKEYCHLNNLQGDRKTLQDIGENFINENPDLFLLNVLTHFKAVDRIVIEGVRHKVILDSIKKFCPSTLTIFLNVPYQMRYERFLLRNKVSDASLKSELEFECINDHPVESGIEALMNDCDVYALSLDDVLRARLTQFLESA